MRPNLAARFSAAQSLSGGLNELEDHELRRLLRKCSHRAYGLRPVGGEYALDRVVRTQVIPMFVRRDVVGEQRVAVLDEAAHRPFVLSTVFIGAGVHLGFRHGPGFGLPDLAQVSLYR